MSLISVVRQDRIHFTSSASRATGSNVGVLYFNFATNPSSIGGIQKLTNSRVLFEYPGKYEFNFYAYVNLAINALVYIEYGLNGSFIILDEVSISTSNHFFSNYSFIFNANANDFFELRVRSSTGAGINSAHMSNQNSDTNLSTTMTIKKL